MNCFIPLASCSPQYHTRSSSPELERPQPTKVPPESMATPVPRPKRRIKSRRLILRVPIDVIPYRPLRLSLLDRAPYHRGNAQSNNTRRKRSRSSLHVTAWL